MISVSIHDKNLSKNVQAIEVLRKAGVYTEEQLQDFYDKQVKKDEGQ